MVLVFLTSFVCGVWCARHRYEGTKIERTRDLFEQAVSNVPAKHAHVLFLLYAKFEEDHGLARRAMLGTSPDTPLRLCVYVRPHLPVYVYIYIYKY